MALDGNFVEARYNHAQLLQALERNDEAISDYKSALSQNPNFGKGHSALGSLYGDLGRYQDAADEFRIALKLNPKDSEAAKNLKMAEDLVHG